MNRKKREILMIIKLVIIFSILMFYSLNLFNNVFLHKQSVSSSKDFSVEIFNVGVEGGREEVLNTSALSINLVN